MDRLHRIGTIGFHFPVHAYCDSWKFTPKHFFQSRLNREQLGDTREILRWTCASKLCTIMAAITSWAPQHHSRNQISDSPLSFSPCQVPTNYTDQKSSVINPPFPPPPPPPPTHTNRNLTEIFSKPTSHRIKGFILLPLPNFEYNNVLLVYFSNNIYNMVVCILAVHTRRGDDCFSFSSIAILTQSNSPSSSTIASLRQVKVIG